MVAAPEKAQTWAGSSKDIVGTVANWMLAECVISNTPWNSLHAGSTLVSRGMEMVQALATHRGIPLGLVIITPDQLLKATQDLAVAGTTPTARLPLVEEPEPEPVVTSGATSATRSTTSGGVTSGGTATTA